MIFFQLLSIIWVNLGLNYSNCKTANAVLKFSIHKLRTAVGLQKILEFYVFDQFRDDF